MSQSKALYRLQTLDLDIEAHRSRIREIQAALEQDEALRQVQAAVADLEEKLRPQETRIADLNLEIKTVEGQTRQLNDRLYNGSIKNPKEAADTEKKLEERKRRRATLEDALLETMIAVEELQEDLSAARQRLEQVEATLAAEHQALTDELKQLRRDLKRLKAERQAAAEQVDPAYIELYQTLRARKQGHAVSVLQGESCSVCGVGQTTSIVQQVRQDMELITCSSCGRILVALG